MAERAAEFEAEGAEIVWVLEQSRSFGAANAETCRNELAALGADTGLCVGDDQTEPEAGLFDHSPFAEGRGFEMFVRRNTMVVEFEAAHGSTTPGGEEFDVDGLLAVLRRLNAE